MAVPATIRVRLSSDAAGAISLTPVVVQEMPIAAFMEHVVAVCGKDTPRIADVLHRGSLVSGGSRLRWEGWQADAQDVASLLAPFPDPDPSRPFNADRCFLATLRGGAQQVPVAREAAEKRRWFKRADFWQHLVALGRDAGYNEYSYREKADVYRARLSAPAQQALRDASELLSYPTLTRQLSVIAFDSVDLYVRR